jgi:hypothetical protein
MDKPLVCPKCQHVHVRDESGSPALCARCGLVFAKYKAAGNPMSTPAGNPGAWPEEPRRFILPTAVTVAIAAVIAAAGLWCVYAGLASWGSSPGESRFGSVILLLFGATSLTVSAITLTLARSSAVRWLGIIIVLVTYTVLTKPSHQRTVQAPLPCTTMSLTSTTPAGSSLA